MSNRWFTADTHFDHHNIIRYCGRPFRDTQHMEDELVARWNGRVQPGDRVYHLGDFGWGRDDQLRREQAERILARLNGEVGLLPGNHDRRAHRWWPGQVVGNSKSVAALQLDGQSVRICHRPTYEPTHRIQLCGHVHRAFRSKYWKQYDVRVINVGVDVWDYAPVSEEELLAEAARCTDGQDGRPFVA
jgi:calcineurin-like phosphoesterase family protein